MEIPGRIQNGVVVFEGSPALPEGAAVTVVMPPRKLVVRFAENQRQVAFPLIESANPGSVHLTNAMIGEILDEEDAPS